MLVYQTVNGYNSGFFYGFRQTHGSPHVPYTDGHDGHIETG